MKYEKTLVFVSIFAISFLAPFCQADPDKKADLETLRNTGEVFADVAEK